MNSKQITYADYTTRYDAINRQLNTLQDEFFTGGISGDVYETESSELMLEQDKLTVAYTYNEYEVNTHLDSIRAKIPNNLLNTFNSSTVLKWNMLANIILEGRQEFSKQLPNFKNPELRNLLITTTHIDKEVEPFVNRYKNRIPVAANSLTAATDSVTL